METGNFYPAQLMANWLSKGSSPEKSAEEKESDSRVTEFARREFSFESSEGVYMRYQSFKTGLEFKQNLERYNPVKIDIGAIFNEVVSH